MTSTISVRRHNLGTLTLVTVLLFTACETPTIVNPNSPSVTGAATSPQAVVQEATGILAGWRGTLGAFRSDVGIFGREGYNFNLGDTRSTSNYLIGIAVGANRLDPAGFAAGDWPAQYTVLRNIYNFNLAVAATSPVIITPAQKSASLGFMKTVEAAVLLQVIETRDTLGAIVQTEADPNGLAPFVSRDSAYRYIISELTAATTLLTAAGSSSFPFTLHSGFSSTATNFSTPAGFVKLTNGFLARAAVLWATEGGPASAWQTAATALQASFLNANPSGLTSSGLADGMYQVYSAASGDAVNPLNSTTNTNLYAHMSLQAQVQHRVGVVGNDTDLRYVAKITPVSPRTSPGAASSSLGFKIWPAATSPMAEIRNEELILLRAEVELNTGNLAATIADINLIRTNSGGLPPTTVTPASGSTAILQALLYERRLSLLMEGDRWVDYRRYGILNQLPLDITSGAFTDFVAVVMPIPIAECQLRLNLAPPLAGPGC
jgi:hypothetical protein